MPKPFTITAISGNYPDVAVNKNRNFFVFLNLNMRVGWVGVGVGRVGLDLMFEWSKMNSIFPISP